MAALRKSILEVVPDAEQCISYGAPAFKVQGKTIAGFAAFKNHLSYLPHSGSVLSALGDELDRYEKSKGSLHFAIDKPLPKRLVKKLVTARAATTGAGARVRGLPTLDSVAIGTRFFPRAPYQHRSVLAASALARASSFRAIWAAYGTT